LVTILAGCTWIEEHPKMAGGAAIGAVAGGVAGGLYKGKEGAVWGSVLGVLAGGTIGAYLDHKDEDAEETKQSLGYNASEGLRLEVLEVSASPKMVKAGGEVELSAKYALAAPDSEQEYMVSEVREVNYEGRAVAQVRNDTPRTTGTYTSVVPLRLPQDAEKGTYTLATTVSTGGIARTLVTEFSVE
jgi:hypothetical protein